MAFSATALPARPVHVEFHFEEPASPARLTPAQLVERIIDLNPTAAPEFLATFRAEALAEYLDHLSATLEPRGVSPGRVRRAGRPAITQRQSML
ncbi:MAG: hypothetical protein SFY69_09480 [Planctomycetota bacterium]|nr:hypothetical protein [Planctomycetota bacterium]